MESSIFRFVLRFSLREQAFLLALTIVSYPFFFLSLDLPKTIINEAIDTDTSAFPVDVFGYELGQIEYLLMLCAVFLGLVLVNGGFKYVINVYRGVVGERMLRRLRYDLFVRVLRFPLPQFRRTSQGELVSMIVAETEPLGGYMGDSIGLPAFQGGMLVTLLVFMFVQDPLLGTAAVALYPIQAWLIPKLQKKLNLKKKEKVRLARALSERIGEVVTGIREVHTHDTSRFERAGYTERVGEIYRVRVQIYRLKFFIKFINNFIAQITPFFFYSIGGYLVIEGDLTFGSLVAVIAAYEKLADPWKELLNFYQIKEDARVKYELLRESFEVPGMLEPELIDAEPETRAPIAGALVASNVDLKEEDEGETTFPGGLSLTASLPASLAIVGGQNSGSDRLAHVVAGLKRPETGQLLAGALDLTAAPEAVTGRQIAYVGPETSLFSGTLRDNLLYSLKHRPTRDAACDKSDLAQWERRRAEAAGAGNSIHDVRADWIDYEGADIEDTGAVNARAIEVLSIAGMDEDIYQLGLQSSVDPEVAPALAHGLLEARRTLRARLDDPDIAPLVELFDRDAYNVNMTVAENLLFGTPKDRTFDPRKIRRQRLRAQGAGRPRPDGRLHRHRAAGRGAHGRPVRGRRAGQRVVRAVQLHLRGGSAGVQKPARPRRARPLRCARGRGPDDAPVAAVQARSRAPPARADRRPDAAAPGRRAAQVLGRVQRRPDPHRVLRPRALQLVGLHPRQHPLRPARLRAPAQRAAHRRADRRGGGRARSPPRDHRVRAGLPGRHRRLAALDRAAPEARDRPLGAETPGRARRRSRDRRAGCCGTGSNPR